MQSHPRDVSPPLTPFPPGQPRDCNPTQRALTRRCLLLGARALNTSSIILALGWEPGVLNSSSSLPMVKPAMQMDAALVSMLLEGLEPAQGSRTTVSPGAVGIDVSRRGGLSCSSSDRDLPAALATSLQVCPTLTSIHFEQ